MNVRSQEQHKNVRSQEQHKINRRIVRNQDIKILSANCRNIWATYVDQSDYNQDQHNFNIYMKDDQ